MINNEEYIKEYMKLCTKLKDKEHFINISTITIISELNVNNLDIQKIATGFNEEKVSIKISKSNKDYEMTKRGKIKKTFFNQVTLSYYDVSKKSIKLFSNGKIQITGITSINESNKVLEMIIRWIHEITGEEVEIVKSSVCLINCNFSINKRINLTSLQNVLNENNNVIARYNPETYPAINMSVYENEKKVYNVFIFSTGNIVITGTKSIECVRLAYEFIINQCKKVKMIDTCTKKQIRKENDEMLYGYTLRDVVSCLN